VFPWIGNPDKAMKWQTNVSGGRICEQKKVMVGTTFEETISDHKGSTTLRGVITKWEIDKLVAFQLDGKYNRADIEVQLKSENRYTIVTQRARIQFKSATRVIMLILGPFFKKKIERE
jgi:hypothetical protein